jgi:hypothetical protein
MILKRLAAIGDHVSSGNGVVRPLHRPSYPK